MSCIRRHVQSIYSSLFTMHWDVASKMHVLNNPRAPDASGVESIEYAIQAEFMEVVRWYSSRSPSTASTSV